MMKHEKAKAWRKRRELTIEQLATLTGYGPRAIMWMEQGLSPPSGTHRTAQPVAKSVWLRYRRMCHGVEALLRTKKEFDW